MRVLSTELYDEYATFSSLKTYKWPEINMVSISTTDLIIIPQITNVCTLID